MLPEPSRSGPRDGIDYSRHGGQAMATSFELLLAEGAPAYRAQAAAACWRRLEDLEQMLSRYRSASDISRLNAAAVGQEVLIGEETLGCLQLAQRLYRLSGGALDVAVGRWTESPAGPACAPEPAAKRFGLRLDAVGMTACRLDSRVRVDLGAIGKGWALDVLADELETWGIRRALLHGGASTALALDPPPGQPGWPVTLRDPAAGAEAPALRTLWLRRAALSGSAQGPRPHIVDPRSGRWADRWRATWARAGTAGLADGWSTAWMVLSPESIARLCRTQPDLGALCLPADPQAAAQSWGTLADPNTAQQRER